MTIQEANKIVQKWIDADDSYATLDLNGLTSAVGLTLPVSVNGSLNLSGLTSAVGLTLPTSVGGGLDLAGLTSADGSVV
jgi:hypothetical protein